MVAAQGRLCARSRANDLADGFNPAIALVSLSQMVQGIHARVSECQGLPPVQAKMLCMLIGGPMRMSELARSLGVEKAALTGLADRAAARGFVERETVPGDRRSYALSLTKSGKKVAQAFQDAAAAELNALMDPLAPAERDLLGKSVTRMVVARNREIEDSVWPTT